MFSPPHVIYGLHSPSADLMLQEISVRAESLRMMLKDMYEQSDRVSRKPSIWPTDSRRRQITSRFGYRKDPFSRRMRHHSGTDVAAPHGERIQVTARGTVKDAGWDNYLGNFVRVDHGYGVETWYGHMSKIGVSVGQQVERGDSVGKVGSTGRSTGPHIHYEVHVNGKRVDPAKYLGQ
jgi:murein DD-endopeptidase MepM/ murein hydrolase activator NlpD